MSDRRVCLRTRSGTSHTGRKDTDQAASQADFDGIRRRARCVRLFEHLLRIGGIAVSGRQDEEGCYESTCHLFDPDGDLRNDRQLCLHHSGLCQHVPYAFGGDHCHGYRDLSDHPRQTQLRIMLRTAVQSDQSGDRRRADAYALQEDLTAAEKAK